jgi:hypothetical protein
MSQAAGIRQQINIVEESYEYMLAYAAQGRADEGAGPDGAQIRDFLNQFSKAVESITGSIGGLADSNTQAAAFLDGFRRESAVMESVIKIMLARDNVSSEVVDNANGLIAVRAYLTSLFFIDKAILPKDA